MKVEEAKGEDEEERESERRGREGRTLLLVECVKREREALGASENGKHSDILSIRHTMFIYFSFSISLSSNIHFFFTTCEFIVSFLVPFLISFVVFFLLVFFIFLLFVSCRDRDD